jgi:1-acyl-sn-glycerol-3-phosphate acyltransferase
MTTQSVGTDEPRRDGRLQGRPASGPELSHISGWLATLLRPVHRLGTWLYFRVEVVNPERIPTTGPAILALTHRSRWDPVVLYCATRRLLRFLASHDEFIGLQGWFMRHLGTFAINTRRPSPSVLKHCRDLILAGEVLVIFPEGTIFYYPPNQVHPIKPGTAWLALECQEQMADSPLPLIPIRTVYGDRYPRFRTRVQVVVQEPIDLRPYLGLPRRVAIRQLTAELERGLGDTVNNSLAEMSPPRQGSPVTSSDRHNGGESPF